MPALHTAALCAMPGLKGSACMGQSGSPKPRVRYPCITPLTRKVQWLNSQWSSAPSHTAMSPLAAFCPPSSPQTPVQGSVLPLRRLAEHPGPKPDMIGLGAGSKSWRLAGRPGLARSRGTRATTQLSPGMVHDMVEDQVPPESMLHVADLCSSACYLEPEPCCCDSM